MAKKRAKEFKRVGKGEDIGVERAISGVVRRVAGWIFGWGRQVLLQL